jgi:hypothetical protein
MEGPFQSKHKISLVEVRVVEEGPLEDSEVDGLVRRLSPQQWDRLRLRIKALYTEKEKSSGLAVLILMPLMVQMPPITLSPMVLTPMMITKRRYGNFHLLLRAGPWLNGFSRAGP